MRITPVLAVLALAAAGCSSTTSKPAPLPAAASTASAASAPVSPAASTAAAATLKIGATATLTTSSGPLQLTVVKVVDPAKPAQSYIYPADGEHWIGVELKFVNSGTKPFIDAPLVDLKASDASGKPQSSFPDQEIAAGPMIDPLYGIHLDAGKTLDAFLTYSVPAGTKLANIQFAPPGGSTAQWSLN